MSDRKFDYDITLSFAGEERPQARELAKILSFRGVKLFYDEFEEAKLWGKDLAAHLHEIYTKKALFCIPFISRNYAEKVWPRHEIKASISKAISQRTEYILPVRVDDTEIPGLASTISYIDLRSKSLKDIVDLCCEKLRLYEEQNPGSIVSNLRVINDIPAWQIEGFDVKVTCPMCKGEGWEWTAGPDDDIERDACRMDCENGKISFFEFLQWIWTVYNARRHGPEGKGGLLTDDKVDKLIAVLYYDFQKYGD